VKVIKKHKNINIVSISVEKRKQETKSMPRRREKCIFSIFQWLREERRIRIPNSYVHRLSKKKKRKLCYDCLIYQARP